ncbi:NAD(P)/FAD-dependent oxidoreductase [Paenibacillus tarimensis]
MTNGGMIIVGAGEAGAQAAVELRRRGWTGSITLIGEENRQPYERPPLSKQALLSEGEPSPAVMLNAETIREHDIGFLPGYKAVKIERDNRAVTLSDGSGMSYERLLLATGAKPRLLTLNGSAPQGVLYLRTFADALAIRGRLRPGKRVAVIGGGFIGLEVAASARQLGCEVTLIEAGPRILMRGVPEEIAVMVNDRHAAAGVVFKLGVSIATIEGTGEGHVITLADGTGIHCEMVIAGIGAVPETSLAAECGLVIENGISVNETLATSDPNIFAAGDCCSFPHPLYNRRRIRLEAWQNAQEQGRHAACSMLGATDPYSVVPWFWSDQYEQSLQVAGLSDMGQTTVERDLGIKGKLFFHLSGEGRLVSVSGIGPDGGIAKEIRLASMLIEKQIRPNADLLADPGTKLKRLLKEVG